MSLPRTARLTLACGALALVAAGCTAAPAPTSAPATPPSVAQTASPTPTATPTQTATPIPTAGGPITLGAPAPSPTTPLPPPGAQTPSVLTVPPGSTLNLDLTNAFRSDGWAAGLHQPAGAASKIPALAATVNCGQPGPELEYRFTQTGGTLRVTAAQDLLSVSSDNTVLVQLVADGRIVNEKALTFKQTAELTAPLNGVTVVKIVAAPQGACRASSTALITGAVVQG
nr:hypothetical protein [Propionibacterium sp.]